jgi:hypothetical protein
VGEYEDIEGKQIAGAGRKNELAVSSFAIAFIAESLMNIVHSACTEEWREGQAYLKVQEHMKKC